jgi:hypothetical protein
MKFNLRSIALSLLAVGTFGMSFMSNVKVQSKLEPTPIQSNVELASTSTIAQLPLVQTDPINSQINSNPVSLPNLTYSFGGEEAHAYWAWVIRGGVWVIQAYNERDIKFRFPNSAQVSWGEASDICNRSSGKLVWRDNLKTCVNK